MSDHNWKKAAPEVPEEFHMKFEETLKQIENNKIIHYKKKSTVEGGAIMSDHNWKKAAPEVPEEFHMKFEETLKQIENNKIIHYKKKSRKMMIRILATAAILCSLAVTTIVAGELFQWNDVLKKRLNPSKEQQEFLADQGYIKGIGQSQTQNGVTITLVNTVQDQNLLYALFKIETDDSISMDDTKGYIKGIGQSQTQNGVTITLVNTVQDQNLLYALFKIETDDSISMDDTTSFENGLNVKIDGTSTYDMDELGSYGAGAGLAYPEGISDISPHLQYYEVSLFKIDGTSTYDMDELGSYGAGAGLAYPEGISDISPHLQYYEVSLSYNGDYDLSGKTVQMELKNLTQGGDKTEDGEVVAEGVWKFEWTLDEIRSMTKLDVNRKCDFGGYEITVDAMELSPLKYTLYMDYEEAMKVYEDERNRFEYNGDDPGMDLTGRTHIDQVR